MKCPKCHKEIDNDADSCPYCHKVLALVCPNCHTLGKNAVCERCGYIILEKCAKCGKTVPTDISKCKCGLPVEKSIAIQECETDEFAAITIKFEALKNIRRLLGSKELFNKFNIKLRNVLSSVLKGIDGKIILYGNVYVINMNKELSFPTSASKAAKIGIKIVNAFTEINEKLIKELKIPLQLKVSIVKKDAEHLLNEESYESNVVLLNTGKQEKKYLKGIQLILDQYVQDIVSKEYKTDSLFSVEKDGQTVMFYQILLDSYILPPTNKELDKPMEIAGNIVQKVAEKEIKKDKYSFKVFDIKAKCKFENAAPNEIIEKLDSNKIISIRAEKDLEIPVSELVEYFESKGKKVLHAVCTNDAKYKPWNLFDQIFREYFNFSEYSGLITPNAAAEKFKHILNLLNGIPRKASTPEDARFAYMDDFINFLSSLKNCTIIIEDFENIDDTSLQTLNLYLGKFNNIVPDFVLLTEQESSAHLKIKGLLRTPFYTEYTIKPASIEALISSLKEDASDFINSFYYEKIKTNFAGSKLYFDHAIHYIREKDVLTSFENKLLIKNSRSILIPATLKDLIRARLKFMSKYKDMSLIFAYSYFIGPRIDYKLLETLGINDVRKNAVELEKTGLVYVKDDVVHVNNYSIVKQVIEESLKKDAMEFLCKNIMTKIGKSIDNSILHKLFGKLSMYKEEYIILWKNLQFCMQFGDYDAYLKNCMEYLSLMDKISETIKPEDIEESKKEIFNNILMSLYNYAPDKIYSIENILLMDAIKAEDNAQIIKLSNLMLQGALISANYTDAVSLLHNILTHMDSPSMIVDGAINTKFLLLSLVNIEILFNIGDYRQCVEVANDILNVLSKDIIEKIKPAGFSTNLFVNHMMDTFRLASLAKLMLMENDLQEFFAKIKNALGENLPDKDCITSIKDFIAGNHFAPSNSENDPPFSKVIYLILQEFETHTNDYKMFAQNIYQAKLLASDLHQRQLELFCDLLIAHSYSKIGINQKAKLIYKDVIEKSSQAAIFNTLVTANYFLAKLYFAESESDEAMLLISDSLAIIQKFSNQAKILYAIFEKLYIEVAKSIDLKESDIQNEEQKLAALLSENSLSRIIN